MSTEQTIQEAKASTTLNERQEKALDGYIEEAREVYGIEGIRRDNVAISFYQENYPGRGSDFDYFYSNGESIVTGFITVYGGGHLCVGEVEWVHNSANEDCQCTPCTSLLGE